MTPLTLQTGLRRLSEKAYKSVHSESIALVKDSISNPLPYFLLGIIASDHGNLNKALELFSKAILYEPGNPHYQVYHAKTLSTLGQQNAAKASADEAAKLTINEAYLADTLGVVYSRSGYHELAMPFFDYAVAQKPDEANYHYNLAASAQFIGEFEKARLAYEATLNLDPKFYRAWSSLISLRRQTPDNNKLEQLYSLFEDIDGGGDAEGQLQLGHAISKTLEDLDRHPESLDWLLRGKKTKRDELRYNRKTGQALFEAVKPPPSLQPSPSSSFSKDTPIFIVGLPRTGTTLVDRILSSHPDVTSAGELNIFAELVKDATKTPSNFVMDAETFLKSQNLDLASVGKAYMQVTQERAKDTPHIIDKMPLNFFYAGLIHRALPNARIIALRRGAMDSCLSNFRQLFSTQYSYYNYTFDLEDTAWFYRQFDSLMSEWERALPANRFIEVQYENIVFDQETQTRRLLDFCNLDWNEACMRFHENVAPVSTASSVQVRRPLYSGSIGRWKKYGDNLDNLRAALGDLANESFSSAK